MLPGAHQYHISTTNPFSVFVLLLPVAEQVGEQTWPSIKLQAPGVWEGREGAASYYQFRYWCLKPYQIRVFQP